jgi:hypothetical protein
MNNIEKLRHKATWAGLLLLLAGEMFIATGFAGAFGLAPNASLKHLATGALGWRSGTLLTEWALPW